MQIIPKAVIFGCEGYVLTEKEREFFQRTQPLGFILFLRNCHDPQQVKTLIQDLKSTLHHDYVPILIDQEGGRVSRLKSPHWRQYPEPCLFGQMADDDPETACRAVELNAYLMGLELLRLGINVNCAPLLDLAYTGAHPVIGSRSFHDTSEVAAMLAYHWVKGHQRSGVTAVLKHLPGHGRATVDSHEALPVVPEALSELQETDFQAFRLACNHFNEESASYPWGMTAHVVYTALDKSAPATLSSTVIQKAIRQYIGFSGFLVSDCLTMKALKGSYESLALKALESGCDAVLHCNGDLNEMVEMAPQIPPLRETSLERLKTGQAIKHTKSPIDEESLWIDLNYHLKPYWGGKKQII